ncbi:putative PX domain superfamily, sorting nexin 2A/B [Helianthus debilis subsp. tardiflorus]
MHKQQDYVEQRRNALDKYLSHHPVIRQSDEFRVFLQNLPFLPTAGPGVLTNNLLGDQDAAGRWDFLRIMNHSMSKSNDSVYEQDAQCLQNKERFLQDSGDLIGHESNHTYASKAMNR